MEHRKAAIEEMKQRLNRSRRSSRKSATRDTRRCWQNKQALEEADELERLVTIPITHTVTTIRDLALSGAQLLGLPLPEQGDCNGSQEEAVSLEKPTKEAQEVQRSQQARRWKVPM